MPALSISNDKDTVAENPDGSVTTTYTDKKTGTVTATTGQADGSKEMLETRKDGTVISTAIDPEGGKVEKVTAANKDTTITVSSSEGKTFVHVALPAQISPPEREFVDVPKDHWAQQGISTMASLGVISGVGNGRYGIEANLQRGDLATMLLRLDTTVPSGALNGFTGSDQTNRWAENQLNFKGHSLQIYGEGPRILSGGLPYFSDL